MKETEILRRTARSFALTLRFLPAGMQSEASLAYLIARGTDTIADVACEDGGKSAAAALRAFQSSLGSAAVPAYDASAWARCSKDPGEQHLLALMPELWRRMQSLEASSRDRMRGVIGSIIEGQIFDVERFGPDRPPLTPDERSRYIYLVAGSVGEYLTDLCSARTRNFSKDGLPAMRRRARSYGEALQLVNIIRDRRMDSALGRVYLAEREMGDAAKAARAGLVQGVDFCAALRSGRLRYALILPALLGFRTLALSESMSGDLLAPVKVPRRELRRWLLRALPVWWSAKYSTALVSRASGAGVTSGR